MKEFEIEVTELLTKHVRISTSDYDADKSLNYQQATKNYKESHYSIAQLLEILQDYLVDDIQDAEAIGHKEKQYCKNLNNMLKDCRDWKERIFAEEV